MLGAQASRRRHRRVRVVVGFRQMEPARCREVDGSHQSLDKFVES